jgi:hypothetical protein
VYALLEAREGVDEPLEGGPHLAGLGRRGEAPAAGDGHQVLRLLRQQEQVVEPCPAFEYKSEIIRN